MATYSVGIQMAWGVRCGFIDVLAVVRVRSIYRHYTPTHYPHPESNLGGEHARQLDDVTVYIVFQAGHSCCSI